MHRVAISRVLLSLAALLMLAGGGAHVLALRKASAVLEASSLSGRYAAIFQGLWLSVGAMTVVLGLSYLILAWSPRLGTRTTLAALGTLPLTGAIAIYATVGNFAPAHLLLAAAAMVLIAAPLSREGTRRPAMPGAEAISVTKPTCP
ncbi:MAG TPA: hypothetical protein VN730_01725 [Steroidobacteraceae bacterium]|nr:hypothetical protein [Steroidobacteraceae bacterium]